MSAEIIHDDFPALTGKKSNYYEHRKTALRWIQMLSGKEWTDYNAHDPGITILETLCYALTEIEYKLNFSIEDLLFASPFDPKATLEDNAFCLAEDILTTAPVTGEDYRKVLIDKVKEINNAWVSKGEQDGFLEVLLLKKNEKEVSNETAILEAKKHLDRYSGYGATFSAIRVAQFDYISLEIDIHLGSQQNVEETLAKMFFNLNEVILNPNPHRQPFHELIAEGSEYYEIFDGPKMDGGIVKSKNLSALPSCISLVKIKKIIASTSGVEMIDKLIATQKKGNQSKKEEKDKCSSKDIKLEKGWVPFFSPNPKYANNDIRVYKNKEPVQAYSTKGIQEALGRMALKTKRDYILKNNDQSPSYTLNAKDRNIKNYYSIKNDFPSAYGFKNKGYSVIQNQDPLILSQLKAYLLPFEQLIANTFMQLSNFGRLFSIKEVEDEIFHQGLPLQDAQLVKIAKELELVALSGKDRFIEKIEEEEHSKLVQRDKYLTHLLARFDVHWYEDFEMHFSKDEVSHLKQHILIKERLLKNIDKTTAYRGVYSRNKIAALTSLEEELYLRMGIIEPPQRPYYKVVSELDFKVKEVKKKKIHRIGKKYEDTSDHPAYNIERIRKSSYKRRKISYHSMHKNVLEELLRNGIKKSAYKLVPSLSGRKYHVTLTDEGGGAEKLIRTEKSKEKALGLIETLAKKLKDITHKSEGFYLVDHALLRGAEADLEFTRYRLSFVFSAWGAHFQQRPFQKRIEDLVYYLVPAHIQADCLWLGLKKMKRFENAYAKWELACIHSHTEEDRYGANEELKKVLKKVSKKKTALG